MSSNIIRLMADVIINKPPNLPSVPADNTTITTIITIVLNVMGAVALLIVTLGGFKYVVSRGDPQSTAKAKDTILYALIGLVVVILGRVIVAFVFRNVTP